MACGILVPLPGIEPVPPKSLLVMSDSLRLQGILQARILEWVAFPFCRGSAQPGEVLRQIFYKVGPEVLWGLLIASCGQAQRSVLASPIAAVLACSWPCPPPCNPVDWGPPGSSVHEILQARTLEWVAVSSSRGSS